MIGGERKAILRFRRALASANAIINASAAFVYNSAMTFRPLATAVALCCTSLATAQDDPAPEPGRLTLIVVDEDGEGLFEANAYVVLTDAEKAAIRKKTGRAGVILDTESSDPDGFLTLDVPPREARQVSVFKRSLTNEVTLEVEPMEPGEEREIEVALKTRPDLGIEVTLVRAEDGEPLAGAEVWREAENNTFPREPLLLPHDRAPDAVTGEDGTFRLEIRSWALVAITVTCDGREPKVIIHNPYRDDVDLDKPVALGTRCTSDRIGRGQGRALARGRRGSYRAPRASDRRLATERWRSLLRDTRLSLRGSDR